MENNEKWVSGWGCSTSYVAEALGSYFKDTTCRYVIIPTMSASKIRLKFSNLYGNEDVELSAATVGTVTSDYDIDKSTITPVTFNNGETSVIFHAGEKEIISDEIFFDVKASRNFALNLYFEKLTRLSTGHSNSGNFIKNCFGRGNYAYEDIIDIGHRVIGGAYLFINTIDFLTEKDSSSIIAFGDSITALPWPDVVNRELNANGHRNRTLIRRAIGGSRVLRSYAADSRKHYGAAGIDRFERDINSVCGGSSVVVLHGINDLFHPRIGYAYSELDELPTIAEMINGYQKYINIAHKYNLKIYFATMLSCSPLATHHESKIGMREALNEWIRTNTEADGYIEFEEALIDNSAPEKMLREYDSGDHLHPNFKGSEIMGLTAYNTLKKFGEI